MKKALALAVSMQLALAAGCASTPEENAEIQDLQQQMQSLDNESSDLAPVVVEQAREAVEKLREMYEDGADDSEFSHQQYITEKKIQIAKETVAMKKAEKTVANAESRRKDLLLEQERQQVRNVQEKVAKMSARAQELEQQVQDLETKETDRGMVLTLENLLFETGEATLQAGSRRTIQKVADFLNEYPDRSILIEGFTDSTGEESFNQQLSERRAQSVKQELTRHGVDSSRVRTEGYGEAYPVASNDTPAGRQQNRRVEVVVANQNGSDVEQRTTMSE